MMWPVGAAIIFSLAGSTWAGIHLKLDPETVLTFDAAGTTADQVLGQPIIATVSGMYNDSCMLYSVLSDKGPLFLTEAEYTQGTKIGEPTSVAPPADATDAYAPYDTVIDGPLSLPSSCGFYAIAVGVFCRRFSVQKFIVLDNSCNEEADLEVRLKDPNVQIRALSGQPLQTDAVIEVVNNGPDEISSRLFLDSLQLKVFLMEDQYMYRYSNDVNGDIVTYFKQTMDNDPMDAMREITPVMGAETFFTSADSDISPAIAVGEVKELSLNSLIVAAKPLKIDYMEKISLIISIENFDSDTIKANNIIGLSINASSPGIKGKSKCHVMPAASAFGKHAYLLKDSSYMPPMRFGYDFEVKYEEVSDEKFRKDLMDMKSTKQTEFLLKEKNLCTEERLSTIEQESSSFTIFDSIGELATNLRTRVEAISDTVASTETAQAEKNKTVIVLTAAESLAMSITVGDMQEKVFLQQILLYFLQEHARQLNLFEGIRHDINITFGGNGYGYANSTRAGMPGSMGGMPDFMGGMPGSMGGMPDFMGGMPGSMGGMPDFMGGMPDSMGGMPGSSMPDMTDEDLVNFFLQVMNEEGSEYDEEDYPFSGDGFDLDDLNELNVNFGDFMGSGFGGGGFDGMNFNLLGAQTTSKTVSATLQSQSSSNPQPPPPPPPRTANFICDNSLEIDWRYYCDGEDDCGDNSDERAGCTPPRSAASTKEEVVRPLSGNTGKLRLSSVQQAAELVDYLSEGEKKRILEGALGKKGPRGEYRTLMQRRLRENGRRRSGGRRRSRPSAEDLAQKMRKQIVMFQLFTDENVTACLNETLYERFPNLTNLINVSDIIPRKVRRMMRKMMEGQPDLTAKLMTSSEIEELEDLEDDESGEDSSERRRRRKGESDESGEGSSEQRRRRKGGSDGEDTTGAPSEARIRRKGGERQQESSSEEESLGDLESSEEGTQSPRRRRKNGKGPKKNVTEEFNPESERVSPDDVELLEGLEEGVEIEPTEKPRRSRGRGQKRGGRGGTSERLLGLVSSALSGNALKLDDLSKKSSSKGGFKTAALKSGKYSMGSSDDMGGYGDMAGEEMLIKILMMKFGGMEGGGGMPPPSKDLGKHFKMMEVLRTIGSALMDETVKRKPEQLSFLSDKLWNDVKMAVEALALPPKLCDPWKIAYEQSEEVQMAIDVDLENIVMSEQAEMDVSQKKFPFTPNKVIEVIDYMIDPVATDVLSQFEGDAENTTLVNLSVEYLKILRSNANAISEILGFVFHTQIMPEFTFKDLQGDLGRQPTVEEQCNSMAMGRTMELIELKKAKEEKMTIKFPSAFDILKSQQTKKSPKKPSFWTVDKGELFVGRKSKIMGEMLWNKVALCDCDKSGSSPSMYGKNPYNFLKKGKGSRPLGDGEGSGDFEGNEDFEGSGMDALSPEDKAHILEFVKKTYEEAKEGRAGPPPRGEKLSLQRKGKADAHRIGEGKDSVGLANRKEQFSDKEGLMVTGTVVVNKGKERTTVCSSNWGAKEAKVACTAIGSRDNRVDANSFTLAEWFPSFSETIGEAVSPLNEDLPPILLSDVDCGGNAQTLLQCSHIWDPQAEKCDSNNRAAVTCVFRP